MEDDFEYDVFISHASEDKPDVADPLADALSSLGMRVWFDKWEISLGDSLRVKIDYGLASSKFGIVILSQAFFDKEWAVREMNALFSQGIGGKKIIPVYHKVNHDFITRKSPLLADILAAKTDDGIISVARQIVNVISMSDVKVSSKISAFDLASLSRVFRQKTEDFHIRHEVVLADFDDKPPYGIVTKDELFDQMIYEYENDLKEHYINLGTSAVSVFPRQPFFSRETHFEALPSDSRDFDFKHLSTMMIRADAIISFCISYASGNKDV
jgi:TIR domain